MCTAVVVVAVVVAVVLMSEQLRYCSRGIEAVTTAIAVIRMIDE